MRIYEGKFGLQPEKNIIGFNKHDSVDFAINLLQTAKTICMTEVKDKDFFKGITLNVIQLYQIETISVRQVR